MALRPPLPAGAVRKITLFGIFLSCLALFFIVTSLYKSYRPIIDPAKDIELELNSFSLSDNRIWDKKYVEKRPQLIEKLRAFEENKLCLDLKLLDNENLSHKEMTASLISKGYSCAVRPIYFSTDKKEGKFLTKDGGYSFDPDDTNIVFMQVCSDPSGECVLRMKYQGFPSSKRGVAHSTKAVEKIGSTYFFKVTKRF